MRPFEGHPLEIAAVKGNFVRNPVDNDVVTPRLVEPHAADFNKFGLDLAASALVHFGDQCLRE